MFRFFLFWYLCHTAILCGSYTPSTDLYPLFPVVQTAPLYKDSKKFVDLKIKRSPWEVLDSYKQIHPESKLELQKFIDQNFEQILDVKELPSKELSFETYLIESWKSLKRDQNEIQEWDRTTLIRVPNPYVVAGERFSEFYYWDSFFSMLGLRLSNQQELLEGILGNFSYLIERFGHIPNGNRTYYLSRSQPPFFSLMVKLGKSPEKYFTSLQKEYSYWQANKKIPGLPLNRYLDASSLPRPEGYKEDISKAKSLPIIDRNALYQKLRTVAESGWDFSSRWEDENKQLVITELAPIDLNCLLYHMELTLAELANAHNQNSEVFIRAIQERKKAINTLFWNEKEGFYFDYNFESKKQLTHFTLAGVFPLFFGLASQEQAQKVAENIEKKFLKEGGVVTTLLEAGEQWDSPNGWAPLQWICIGGLRNYGFNTLADEISKRWLKINRDQYASTGYMIEKYDVIQPHKIATGGEYEAQRGFGWTNGVAQDLLHQMKTGESIYNLFQPSN